MSTSTKFWSVLLLVCVGLLSLALLHPATSTSQPHLSVQTASGKGLPTPHPTPIRLLKAFRGIHRLNQVDPGQYTSQTPYGTWWPSACSAAVMTEAVNSYGYGYRLADILRVEAAFHNPTVITPDAGLLYASGLDRTLRTFGFQATQLQHPTVPQLEHLARTAPVIINFPPFTWPGGHFLIITGGDTSHVTLADSSRLNMPSMSVAMFLSYWRGLAFVVLPVGQGVQA